VTLLSNGTGRILKKSMSNKTPLPFVRQFTWKVFGWKQLPVVLLVAVLTLMGVARPVAAATPEQVADSIARAKAYLYSRQLHGNWEAVRTRHGGVKDPNDPNALQFGGMTAIATFALLACGDSPTSNDHLREAVDWLEKADMRGIYAISLRAQIWNLLPDDETVKKMRRHDKVALLEDVRHGNGLEAGYFGYGEGMDKRQYDHSVSQFGVLGLWSAQQGGEEIETRVWKEFDKAWRSQQRPDGSWCYLDQPIPPEVAPKADPGLLGEELSMTAAGVATLFITQDYVSSSARCEGNIKDSNIANGMQWVGSHLEDIDSNNWAKQWRYYTMFGICRIGLASGFRYIGDHDWFQWGANTLLKEQDADGSWGSGGFSASQDTPAVEGGVFNTAFSLLFLSRGRAPVLFNKLQYNTVGSGKKVTEANWNQRPRDVANLTRFLARESETQLNWQIVNLTQPVSEMIEAPMLFMSGNQALKLTQDDQEKLKEYINEGGIIVGHADCSNAIFADTFRKLGQAMFPGQVFHELPADHPIFRNENFPAKLWSPVPKMEALDNGARVQMLLLPVGDPAREWQTQTFPAIKKYTYGQLMMNIYLYAVDKQGLRTKGDTFVVKRRETISATNKDAPAKIARLQYTGNWDPEPGGWVRIANMIHNHNRLDIDVETVQLGNGSLTKDYKLAHLTGTSVFTLTDPQRQEIKKYVDGGGTLLIDAAGGKSAFALSAQQELGKIFPGTGTPPVLPIKSDVYATVGDPITDVTYRSFAKQALGNLRSPQLRGMEMGTRIGVFLSNEDLSVGMVGQPVDGIIGYDPASATHMVESIVLYALH
jgi:hypothetical protein